MNIKKNLQEMFIFYESNHTKFLSFQNNNLNFNKEVVKEDKIGIL